MRSSVRGQMRGAAEPITFTSVMTNVTPQILLKKGEAAANDGHRLLAPRTCDQLKHASDSKLSSRKVRQERADVSVELAEPLVDVSYLLGSALSVSLLESRSILELREVVENPEVQTDDEIGEVPTGTLPQTPVRR